MASIDVELQRIIEAWPNLPASIRKAILGLVESQG
jgi:hypothetical protein